MEENMNIETENKEVVENKETKVEENVAPVKSAEEQLAEMRVQLEKLKKATDKATAEASSYKKQLRERQSAEEIAAEEKAKQEALRQEEIESMRRELSVSKFEKNFLSLGYGEELANKAAIATYENNTEELFEIQKSFTEQLVKNAKAELVKNMPVSPISNDSNVSMTQEQFNKMSVLEQVELKNRDYELYKKFAN